MQQLTLGAASNTGSAATALIYMEKTFGFSGLSGYSTICGSMLDSASQVAACGDQENAGMSDAVMGAACSGGA